jgi:hypothetical protein
LNWLRIGINGGAFWIRRWTWVQWMMELINNCSSKTLCHWDSQLVEIMVFWDVTQYSLVHIYQTLRRHIAEDRHIGSHRWPWQPKISVSQSFRKLVSSVRVCVCNGVTFIIPAAESRTQLLRTEIKLMFRKKRSHTGPSETRASVFRWEP